MEQTTTTTYRPASRPVGAFGIIPDCARCGETALKHPVYLADDSGRVAAYGTGCAALLLGWNDTATAPANFLRRFENRRQLLILVAARAERDAWMRGDITGQDTALETLRSLGAIR